jgi:3-oxoacyl-[acyl-carrier-protein] synthase II
MSIFAVQAAIQAVAQAKLTPQDIGSQQRVGCMMGSTTGSSQTLARTYERLLTEKSGYDLLGAAEFFMCISHTVAMNVAQYYGIQGVVSSTNAACASGLQAVGAGYDQIRMGRQDIMLCGGGEELHETTVGSFDILYAASTGFNDSPSQTPRPFDAKRDGLVCGEGAGVLVLESLEHAKVRNAEILAEITGYHTCSNGTHVSQSDDAAMTICMNQALEEARLSPSDIGYVNAHATGTAQGDAAEVRAIARVFGDQVPVSSLKGHMGHTLGCSGPIELAAAIEMMRRGVIHATANLDEVAPDCQGVAHVQKRMARRYRALLKNSFAFGGINSAIVCTLPE